MVMAGRRALSGAGNMKYIFYNIIVSGHEFICGLMHVVEVGRGSGEIRDARYMLILFSICYCFQRDGIVCTVIVCKCVYEHLYIREVLKASEQHIFSLFIIIIIFLTTECSTSLGFH